MGSLKYSSKITSIFLNLLRFLRDELDTVTMWSHIPNLSPYFYKLLFDLSILFYQIRLSFSNTGTGIHLL